MIDQIDKELKEWVETTLQLGSFFLISPNANIANITKTDTGIGFYLLELSDAPPLRTNIRSPLQFSLNYLVFTWAKDPLEAHKTLASLVFAAMTRSNTEVRLEPPSPSLWTAFGIPPQPSFILRTTLRMERPTTDAKPVLFPLVVRDINPTNLRGIVLGLKDKPIVNALIELPNLGLSTKTNPKGQFCFDCVPNSPIIQEITVNFKGKTVVKQLQSNHPDDQASGSSQEYVIHLE
jgi:hypothetical protein